MEAVSGCSVLLGACSTHQMSLGEPAWANIDNTWPHKAIRRLLEVDFIRSPVHFTRQHDGMRSIRRRP
jgi:hypothetical protein